MLFFKSKLPFETIYVYYAALLIVMAFGLLTLAGTPNLMMRIIFLVAVFYPIIFKSSYKALFPACVISFYTVMQNSTEYALVPYDFDFYLFISFSGLFFAHKYKYKIDYFLLSILIYIFILDSLRSSDYGFLTGTLTLLFLFSLYIDINDKKLIFSLLNCFSLVSLVLAVYYLNVYDSIASEIVEGEERVAWQDPNYFSGILGMGIITSFVLLSLNKTSSLYWKIFWTLAIVFPFVVQLNLASRGGFLATAVSLTFLLLFSNIKKSYKFLVFLFFAAFVYYLYTNSYFELLIARVEADDGTGSNRTYIWATKLQALSHLTDENILNLIFGLGSREAFHLGFNHNQGFHNDFIAALCAYGVIGLITFLCMLIYPVLKVAKQYRREVIALTLYIFTILLTLEPMTTGIVHYWGFYFTIYMFSVMYSKKIS